MRFAIKLTLLFVIITLISGITASYFIYLQNVKVLKEETTLRLESDAKDLIDQIDGLLSERYHGISVMALAPVLRSRDSTPEQITKRLIEFRDVYKTYASLSFFDLNRVRIADTAGMHIGQQHPLIGYWEDVLQGKVSAASDIRVAEDLNTPIIYFASPVKDNDGKPFGAVVVRMPISRLYDVIGTYSRKGAEVDLIDKEGILLYSNHERKELLTKIQHIPKEVIKLAETQTTGSLITKDGELYAFSKEQGFLDFKGNEWAIIIHIPTEIVFSQAVKIRNQIIITFAILFIIVLISTFFLSKIFTKPLTQFKEAGAKLGKGQLNTRLNIKTGDEFEEMANAFNKTAQELKKFHAGLEKQVAERTSELKGRTEELEKARLATLNILEDIKESNEKLKELDKLKTDFLNTTSHELKTPLTPIISYLDLLEDGSLGKLSGEQKSALQVIDRNSQRLRMLIDDILDTTRLEAGRMKFIMGKQRMEKIVKETVESLNPAAKEKGIKINMLIPTRLPMIIGDRQRLSQVVNNFLFNAIKFSPKNSKIEVGIEKEKSSLKVYVKDQGIGISEKDIHNLFTRFFQVDNSATREQPGTGLGLFICKGIIQNHGGKVGVESKLGKGSTFYFTIPFKRYKKE